MAEIIDVSLPEHAAEDSFSVLPALLDMPLDQPIRLYLLQQGFGGSKYLAVRSGRWKYLAHKGSGGNNYQNSPMLKEHELPDTAPDASGQLFDFESHSGETINLSELHPQVVEQLELLLRESISNGRSNDYSESR